MTIKRISVDLLRIGMYVAGLDQSWLSTRLLSHKFLIRHQKQIEKLRQAGVRSVEIDTDRGYDLDGQTFDPSPRDVWDPYSTPTVSASPAPAVAPLPPPREDAPTQAAAQERRAALGRELAEARTFRQSMLRDVRRMMSSFQTTGAVQAAQVAGVAQDIITHTLTHETTLVALIKTREFDPDLCEHALSVSTLTVVLGRLLDYEPARLHVLAMGALLHDYGLLGLPVYINRRMGLLSESERRLFDTHALVGADMLRALGHFPTQSLRIVARHHAILTSKAVPVDLAQKEEIENCCLVQVVDRYDELLTGQGERQPVSPREALRLLYQEAESQRLDLDLVSHLVTRVGIYPVCSIVELTSGQRGIVLEVKPGDLLHPTILVTHGANGKPYPTPTLVDLGARKQSQEPLEIQTVLNAEEAGVDLDAVLWSDKA